MTKDKAVIAGIDRDEPLVYAAVPATGDWDEVSFRFTIPEDTPSEYVFVETDGKADFFIDDVSLTIVKEGDNGPDSEIIPAEKIAALTAGSATAGEPADADKASETVTDASKSDTAPEPEAQPATEITTTGENTADQTGETKAADEKEAPYAIIWIICGVALILGVVIGVVITRIRKAASVKTGDKTEGKEENKAD